MIAARGERASALSHHVGDRLAADQLGIVDDLDAFGFGPRQLAGEQVLPLSVTAVLLKSEIQPTGHRLLRRR